MPPIKITSTLTWDQQRPVVDPSLGDANLPQNTTPRKSKLGWKHLGGAALILLLIVLGLSLLAPDLMSSAITNTIKDMIEFFVIVFKL